MIFICVMTYGDDRHRLDSVRPRHRSYMRELIERGVAIVAGSFVPEDDGGLFIYDVETSDDARRLVHRDPYVTEGVVASWTLRGYEVHGAHPERLLAMSSHGSVDESQRTTWQEDDGHA